MRGGGGGVGIFCDYLSVAYRENSLRESGGGCAQTLCSKTFKLWIISGDVVGIFDLATM